MIANTRINANLVAEKLAEAEAALDAAISAVASLTATMPAAGQNAQVGFHVMQEAMMHAMESCSQLVKSRTNLVRTHSALRSAQDAVGLGEVMFNSNCPDKAELVEAPVAKPGRHLAAVA